MIDIQTDFTGAISKLQHARDNIGKAVDSAARQLTKRANTRMKSNIAQNESIVTGKSVRSMRVKSYGLGDWGLTGREELKYLEEGTPRHWVEVQGNPDLKMAAMKYNMSPYDLQAIIAMHGTKPHEFAQPAREFIRKIAPSYLGTRIKEKIGAE